MNSRLRKEHGTLQSSLDGPSRTITVEPLKAPVVPPEPQPARPPNAPEENPAQEPVPAE
jgi:hypothetical protein